MKLVTFIGYSRVGKSSTILALASALQADGKRIRILHNGPGRLNADGLGLDIVEMHGGCVCCDLAFIINDLAEMDVDGQILSTENTGDLSITRLSSGCVCCTLKGEFEQTVDQIISTLHPDALIVESSGVANPAAVLHGLNHPSLRLDSVVCVIDAERFTQYARTEVFADGRQQEPFVIFIGQQVAARQIEIERGLRACCATVG